MPFDPSKKPDILSYLERFYEFNAQGRGKWRNGPHAACGSSDALRFNTESGGGRCMSCGFTFGDAIGFHMKTHDVSFTEAAKALGAWVDGPPDPNTPRLKPLPFSARDALELVAAECLFVAVFACNMAKGIEHATNDRDHLVEAAARIRFIAEEVLR